MAKENNMTQLWVNKRVLKELHKVMTNFEVLSDSHRNHYKPGCAEGLADSNDVKLLANETVSFLTKWNDGLGSIVKPTHRRIASSVDELLKKLIKMQLKISIWQALTDDKIHSSVIKILEKNAYWAGYNSEALSELNFVYYKAAVAWTSELREVCETWRLIKPVVEAELDSTKRG